MALLTRELTAAAMLAVLCTAPAWAQQTTPAPAKTPTPQQQRMADCNKTAADKKGDERKAYMSSCLKGEAPAKAATPQQQRMKDCNTQASSQSLMGDKRRAFMKTCLSNKT
ncbi:phosphate starvation-inducible protein [Bordetella ansorpii]|uniref:Phosphate starvation-inducible protein n=1 Tax=Bordetella ansorpii TaxID=288768 RepID=A0A157QYA6_9BORD|nr:PsiF family protein [Bordetella ansorpii]SAI49919.1 phosphate starvation-inducible protein [Bordetella ansorpii]